MKYKNFEPPASDAPATGPSKEDLLTQIEADHWAAKQRGDKEEMALLDDRHAKVDAARSSAAAAKAYYEHVREVRDGS